MTEREKRREALEAERLRDELAARETEDQARVKVRLRPHQRVTVRIVDETGKGNSSIEVEADHDRLTKLARPAWLGPSW